MNRSNVNSKTAIAKSLGISRSSLYYTHKLPLKDKLLKHHIEHVLSIYPFYGSRRIAKHLNINRKRIKRVINIYGIKPYRRRRRFKKVSKSINVYPNLLMYEYPSYTNHIWASDFTHLTYKNKQIYVCTVIDLFSRKIIGTNILTSHSNQLTIGALFSALHNNPIPQIFHSDNGSEYDPKDFIDILNNLNIKISRSNKGCPWENGYQESFYDKFKVELGDPNRFDTLGKLVFNIYQTIYTYNHTRIHSALQMSPVEFMQSNNLERKSV